MEKSVAVRRKAQQLARKGQIEHAIEEMKWLLETGEADPYDYVFQGDLLVQGHRMEDGISSFHEALSAYERVGLFRNAIAVGKKILRADPAQARTYQRLGELYAKEGLMGESIVHFFTFLDKSGGEVSGEEFVETLERVVQISSQSVEVALRLAELYVRVGRERRAAELLEEVAVKAEEHGGLEIAAALRQRAADLVPTGDGSAETPAGDQSRSEEGDLEVPPALNPDESTEDLDWHLEQGKTPEARGELLSKKVQIDDRPLMTSLTDEITAVRHPESAPSQKTTEETPPDGMGAPSQGVQTTRDGTGDPRRDTGPDDIPRTIEDAEKLVADARQEGDRLATVRNLVHLGDLRIAAEDLQGAVDSFLEVLRLDPANPTARRRLARFRQMNLPSADRIEAEYREAIRSTIEIDGATVTVEDAEGVDSDEWIDLTSLLERFQEGVSGQVKPDDYAGHYDLGLSYHEMGLFREALEEFDRVLLAVNLPSEVELKTREMRGTCLCDLERFPEAVDELRRALEIPELLEERVNALRFQLACALESAGKLDEAREIFRDLAQDREVLSGVREHLERLDT